MNPLELTTEQFILYFEQQIEALEKLLAEMREIADVEIEASNN